MFERIKPFLSDDSFYYTLIILLVAVASFGLGRWSLYENGASVQSATVVMKEENLNTLSNTSEKVSDNQYVASKSGSKYHLLWCPGASQIKEENKLFFASKEAAEAQGFTPAANCPGI